jgi:hypothetical protein
MPQPLPPWGLALERLLLQTGRSKSSLSTDGIMSRQAFRTMCRSKLGPSVWRLGRWLRGVHLTWHDWATAYEQAERTVAVMRVEQEAAPSSHVNADNEAAALRQVVLNERLEDYHLIGHRIELAPPGAERKA